MSIRLGASAFTAFDGDIEAFCGLLCELGLDRCELRNYIGGDSQVDGSRVTQIKSALGRWGLKSTVHAPWKLNLAAASQSERDHALMSYQRAVDIAHELGSDVLVFHGGWIDGANLALSRAHALQAIGQLVTHASDSGVVVALENDEVSRPTLFRHPDDFRGLEVPDLHYVLDVGHAHTMGYGVADFIGVYGERLKEIHLHDNDGNADQHRAIGHGTIDWPAVAAALISHSDGIVVLECKSVPCLNHSVKVLSELWPSLVGA